MIVIATKIEAAYYYTNSEDNELFDVLRISKRNKNYQKFVNENDIRIQECGNAVKPSYLTREEFDKRIEGLCNEGYEQTYFEESKNDEDDWDIIYSISSKDTAKDDVLEINAITKEYRLWEREELLDEEREELYCVTRELFDLLIQSLKEKGFKRV